MELADRFELIYWSNRLAELPTVTLFLILAAGLLFLLYGRTLFKLIVTLNAALLAGAAGWTLGQSVNRPGLMAIGFALIFGLLAWPLFKFGIALLAGLIGALMATGITSLVAPESSNYLPIAAVLGFIAFAVAGFFLIMPAVMVFTTLEGATVVILSLLTLTNRAGLDLGRRFGISLDHIGVIHAAILILGLIGMLYQLGMGGHAEPKPKMPLEPTKKK